MLLRTTLMFTRRPVAAVAAAVLGGSIGMVAHTWPPAAVRIGGIGPSVLGVALTAVFGIISLMSCALYLGGGVAIGRFLASPLAFRVFNLFMGGLTIGSVALLFL